MTEKPRIAYHTDLSHQDPQTRKFFVIKVEENEPGYWRTPGDFDTLDTAKAYADKLNGHLGLHADDVLDIRVSSMAAHNAAKYGEPTPKLEILHDANNDHTAECSVRVWVDGVEVTAFTYTDVDPGRGYTRHDWDESHRERIADPDLSESYRAAVDNAYTDGRESKWELP